MIELLRLLLATLAGALRSRQRLLLENLLLRQQLQVALRSQRRPRLRIRDKLFWLVARRVHRSWRHHLRLVRPETELGWHRQGWRLFWRWRSGRLLGRPRLNPEIRDLIATIAAENPHWGTERIRGELLNLGIAVSARSIRRYRRRGPARPPSQSWRTFLANHAQSVWAADLFVVQTLTFQTLYVSLISHHRRRLLHFNVTAHPTAAWVWRQTIEATPWDRHLRYLIHDRDCVYGADFAARLAGLGIESVRTPVQAPRAKRHRGEGCADPTSRVLGPHPAAERAACPSGVDRVRDLLQPRPTPSIHRSGDPRPEPSAGRREGGRSAGPRRLAPRLRTRRLNTTPTFALLQV
jgi:putative transposase